MPEATGYGYCLLLYIVAHLLGASTLLWIGLWINYDQAGFGFRERVDLEFKFHPICMALSLAVLNGEAIMIYRGLRSWPNYITKAIHFLLHSISFISMVAGLQAVWDFHDYHQDKNGDIAPLPNALSSHSWAGLATATLYGVQFAGGLVVFYFPPTPVHVRSAFMPLHRSLGLVIFAFSFGSVLMGTGEKTAWSLQCKPPGTLCTENLYVNLFVLSLMGYGSCVLLIAIPPHWIRKPLPDEVTSPAARVLQVHPQENNHLDDAIKTSL